jgi:hypothetical protein
MCQRQSLHFLEYRLCFHRLLLLHTVQVHDVGDSSWFSIADLRTGTSSSGT